MAACTALAVTLIGVAVTLLYFLPMSTVIFRNTSVLRLASAGFGAGALSFPAPAAAKTELPQWIAFAWLIGIALFQLRALGGWLAVSRLRRSGVFAPEHAWQARMNRLAADLFVKRPTLLLESAHTRVPVVIGHLKPVVLVPVGLLTGLPSAQVEAILLHELAHVRRHDYLINLLQTVVEGILFYHPAVWWISSTVRAERENCCDDLVVAVSGDAHQYAKALTALAESSSQLAMAASGSSVVNRVRRLLQLPEAPRAGLGPLVIAGLLVVVCALGITHAKAAPQTAALNQTSYMKWLNEDVTYIIRDDERAAFKRLATDEEREKFIEQFWLRRDPTPNTPENEFKIEHYRRIAYVNARYGASTGLPGWKTDRGRIYITYGPPDEIESHPSSTDPRGFPYEQWKYKLIEGVGQNVIVEFDDTNKTGEYPMTRDPQPPKEKLAEPHKRPSQSGPLFAVDGNGLKAAMEVNAGRFLKVAIPIDNLAEQFNLVTRITTLTNRPVEMTRRHLARCVTKASDECLVSPAIEFQSTELASGTYKFAAAVKEYPSEKLHVYTGQFHIQ
jgi:GWxTD domain-containing protein